VKEQGMAFAFEFGTKVRLAFDPELQATVTAYCVRPAEAVTYEVTWMHNGDVKTAWFPKELLKAVGEDKKPVGFKS